MAGEERDVASGYSASCSCRSCDYRSLYEGALSSLSEMASNQRRSVERLGRSRAAVASLFAQSFPLQAREMERRSGRRVADLSDEEMMAALAAAIRSRRDSESEQLIDALASKLSALGFPLPDDRSRWPEMLLEPTSAEAPAPGEKAPSPASPAPAPPAVAAPPPAADPAPDRLPPLFPAPQGTGGAAAAGRELRPAASAGADPVGSEGRDAAVDAPGEASDSKETAGEASDPDPKLTQDAPESSSEDEGAAPPLRAPATLFQPPLRPGVPERRASRRPARPATSYPEREGVELSESDRASLLEAVSVPRPVFTSDLVLVAGSERLVDEWEAHCRADPASSPVRFIAPKSRHRHRGRLVVPGSPDLKSPKDWWSRCVSLYRAGRLYELAVVLRHVQDDILSVQMSEEYAVLRLRGEAGASAVAVLLSPLPRDGEKSPLEDILTQLSQERLDSIVLLSASGEKDAREAAARSAARISADLDLQISCPIVAAVSWEYVDDPKSASVFVRV